MAQALRGTLVDNMGAPLASVQITVYEYDTTDLADLFYDKELTQACSNPVNSEADGSYLVYAADGSYDLVFYKAGVTFDDSDSVDEICFDGPAHKGQTTGAHTASAITNVPAGQIVSTNVQDAINELDTQKIDVADVSQTPTANKIPKAYSTKKIDAGWLPLVGFIEMYGGSSAPDGWLMCDGSAISRTTYADLFAVIGVAYGVGDGSTTFNLPDFRGIFPKGAGTTDRTEGKDAAGNYYSGIRGTYLQDKIQGHYHNCAPDANVHDFDSGSTWHHGDGGGSWCFAALKGNVAAPSSDGVHGIPRTGYTTEPQSLGVNFIIKY